ncbi:MAG: choice-of-anchor I family protein [Pseudomonadales bacterium]|nr:choice-of-anchor I family protein [Pseudomonadales bacterium]
MKPWHALGAGLLATTLLSACGGDSNNNANGGGDTVATPDSIKLVYQGRYEAGSFDKSAAEIPAYDSGSRRLFVVNAEQGVLDVLDLSDPSAPQKVGTLSATDVADNVEVNSVAVYNGLVAVAIESDPKTDNGFVAIYQADDLSLLGSVEVGAQPDMVAFTPDGSKVLTANEGEPSDDYSVDPDGSISIVDITDPENPAVSTAGFGAFDAQELRDMGVRIYGPNAASAAQNLEPEYIAISADSATAWVTLQENNALAKIDIAAGEVTDILPLGEIDRSTVPMDFSDDDEVINITTYDGVVGLYQPDAIHAYSANGSTWLVTANEGDARAWGEDNDAYWGEEADDEVDPPVVCEPDASQGFVEEFRVKHLVHASGFDRRCGDDMPPQLRNLAEGALLDPAVFGYCGATAGDPGDCREDDVLGRLNITWVHGYKTDENGDPLMYTDAGVQDDAGTRIMYDTLYSYGGRSFSIWDEDGNQVFDSGDAIEQFLASDDCWLGEDRDEACQDYFNTGHDEIDALDSRSDAKGPEPEGLTIGAIGDKTFLFLGLERMGGVLVYDITDPAAPVYQDYLNSRNYWGDGGGSDDIEDLIDDGQIAESEIGSVVGDLGPEGLVFIPVADSPNGKALLVVGHEVSGTTAVYEVQSVFSE